MFEFQPDRFPDTLEHLEIYGRNVVTTLLPSFLNGSSSFLQVTRTTKKLEKYLIFWKIQHLATELAAIECLKDQCLHLFSVAIDVSLF